MTTGRYSEERLRMAEELFSIDVDAEIRKLGRRQQKTKGESVVELLEFAAAMKPSKIEITLERNNLELRCEGGEFDSRIAYFLKTIMDPEASADSRHRAVVSIEDLGGLPILSAFKSKRAKVFLEWKGEEKSEGLLFVDRQKTKSYEPAGSYDFRILIKSRREGLGAELEFVRNQTRYADVHIYLNGKRVSFGLHLGDCLLEKKFFGSGLRGIIGIPKKGSLVNLITLKNGIVVKQTVLFSGSGIAADAVIEKNSKVDMGRLLEVIEDHCITLYSQLKERFESFDETSKDRIGELVLEYCLQTGSENFIRGMKVFKQSRGQDLTLEQVEEKSREGKLYAIRSDDSPLRYGASSNNILVLGELEQRFIETFLKQLPALPPPKIRRSGFKLGLIQKVRSLLDDTVQFFPSRPGRSLSDEELDTDELDFLRSVRNLVKGNGLGLFFSANQSSFVARITTGDRESLYISRDHSKTRKMVRGFSRNPLYVYPALELVVSCGRIDRTRAAFCGRSSDA